MLLKPLITEKSMAATGAHRYSFVVEPSDTKTAVKHLVEQMFKVKVLSVHTSVIPGKSYRTGKRGLRDYRSDYKKAIVTIKPDQKIDLFDVPETK